MKLILILLFPLSLQAQKPKSDTAYYLIGKLQDFKLLFKAVNFPEDVTRKEIQAVTVWINSAKMLLPDTTKPAIIKPKK